MRRATCVPFLCLIWRATCASLLVLHKMRGARPIEMSLRFAISIGVADEPTVIPIANIVQGIQWKWIKASVFGSVCCVCVRVLSFIMLSTVARRLLRILFIVHCRTTFGRAHFIILRYYHFQSISFAPREKKRSNLSSRCFSYEDVWENRRPRDCGIH